MHDTSLRLNSPKQKQCQLRCNEQHGMHVTASQAHQPNTQTRWPSIRSPINFTNAEN